MKNLGAHSTDRQKALVLERSNRLRMKIQAWYAVQQLYMPGAAALRSQLEQKTSASAPLENVWDLKLFLPSEIFRQAPCDDSLREYEWRLREAQAYESLQLVRDALLLSTHLHKFKTAFVRGQRPSTRTRTVIDNTHAKRDAAVLRYRIARAALVRLSPLLNKPSAWQAILRPLADGDVKPLSDKDLSGTHRTRKLKKKETRKKTKGNTEGTRILSWIWMAHGVATNAEMDKSLHDCE